MANFIRILVGDVREVLTRLPDRLVDTCVTSPPYFSLRFYLDENDPNKSLEIGLEKTPSEYVSELVGVFSRVKRVLKDEGTLWVNLGDSYVSKPTGSIGNNVGVSESTTNAALQRPDKTGFGLANKNIIGTPWRLAFGLQDDSWILRSEIIWAKGVSGSQRSGSAMPESVKDRCTKSHETIFMLAKNQRYYFDNEAIKEPSKDWGTRDRSNFRGGTEDPKLKHHGLDKCDYENGNGRSVWMVNPTPFKGSHFATFPIKLIEPCVLSFCPVGGIVLDPFGGSGTTGICATKNKRNCILVELSQEYVAIMLKRLNAECPIGTKIIVEYPDRIEEFKVRENKENDEFFDFEDSDE